MDKDEIKARVECIIGKELNFRRSAKLDKFSHDVGDVRGLDARDEFAIRVESCAPFAKADIVLLIEFSKTPKAVDGHDPLFAGRASLNEVAGDATFHKADGGKKPGRTRPNNERSLFCTDGREVEFR